MVLMFATDTHHGRIKRSVGLSLLFIIYSALPVPFLNYLIFRLLLCSSVLLPPRAFFLLQETHWAH